MSYDPVNRPAHYAEGRKYEPIAVIEDWKLNYRTGSAVKYISRAGRKQDAVEDLQKAVFYLQREIDALQKPNPYAVPYADVVEDYEATAKEEQLDQEFPYWDPSLGPAEPYSTPTTTNVPTVRLRQDRTTSNDYIGQAQWL
jgi:hypothetical protein